MGNSTSKPDSPVERSRVAKQDSRKHRGDPPKNSSHRPRKNTTKDTQELLRQSRRHQTRNIQELPKDPSHNSSGNTSHSHTKQGSRQPKKPTRSKQTPEREEKNMREESGDEGSSESGPARLWMKAMKNVRKSKPHLWQTYNQRITQDLAHAKPDEPIGDSVIAALTQARADYKDTQWGYERKDGTRVDFGTVVERILQRIESVKDFGAALASCDPFHAVSVGWAGIQFFVKASLYNKQTRDLVLDDQGFIADIIQFCATTENVYLQKISRHRPGPRGDLQDAIVKLYERILVYNIQALSYLDEPKIVSGLAALAPDEARDLKKTIDSIKEISVTVDACLQNVQGDSLNNITAAIVAMGEQLQALARLSSANEEEVTRPELYLLGSEEILEMDCPPRHRRPIKGTRNARFFPMLIEDIPKEPQWLRLLMFFSRSFDATHPDYVDDELQMSRRSDPRLKERRVDPRTIWRILCGVEHTKIPTDMFKVTNFFVGGMKISVQKQGTWLRLESNYFFGPLDYLKLPSLDMANQILGYKEASPGGSCGEKYVNHSQYKVKSPYILCMVQFPVQTRLYPESQLKWAWLCFRYLTILVCKMWKDDEQPTKEEIVALCKYYERSRSLPPPPNSWNSDSNLDIGPELMPMLFPVIPDWHSIAAKTKNHFEQDSAIFEVEDVVKILQYMSDQQMSNTHNVYEHAEAYFGEGARWILLALLLNLIWNLNPSCVIPKAFQALLDQRYCIVG